MRDRSIIVALCMLLSVSALAQQPVGETVFVRGAATAQDAAGTPRILGQGAPLFEGDVVRTARHSFAVLRFVDGTTTSLRPSTVFAVEDFEEGVDAEDPSTVSRTAQAAMRLFEGGLRLLSGLIAKRNSEGFRVETPVATLAVRGTEFEARLCEEDCQRDARVLRQVQARESPVVARLAYLSGPVSARGLDRTVRQLALGGALFEGDLVETGAGALAILVFRDESRVTLRENSQFGIDNHRYDAEDAASGSTLMRLVKGAVRVTTGIIARSRPANHVVATPVATLSVRGTEFDIHCRIAPRPQPPVPADPQAAPEPPDPCTAIDIWVREGVIAFALAEETLTIGQGQAWFLNLEGQRREYPDIPQGLEGLEWPDPDPTIDPSNLFAAEAQDELRPGLFVKVIQGDVRVSDRLGARQIFLGAGEAAWSDPVGEQLTRLVRLPRLPEIPDPSLDYSPGADLLGPPAAVGETQFECVVQ